MPKAEKRKAGRPLMARTDTERLDLLVELIGFGRGRADVSFGWGGENNDGPLELHVGPAGEFQTFIADDSDGDPRRLLDRAMSSSAAPARTELAKSHKAAAKRRRDREAGQP